MSRPLRSRRTTCEEVWTDHERTEVLEDGKDTLRARRRDLPHMWQGHLSATRRLPALYGRGARCAPFRGTGQVYSFSTVYDAPADYVEYQPYTVALIKLDEGPLVTAQLTDVDNEDVHIGMPVEMVTRKIKEEGENGLIVYGYKFRPVLEEVKM